MSEKVTATEAALRFPDLLERVRRERETFLIVRGDEEVGRLTPAEPSQPFTLLELLDLLQEHGHPDPQFAEDLEEIQAAQPPLGDEPWPS
jgi:antitoxin (DNA-binding transcriptional repressor) of toxin-antitoxin stability system